MQAFHFPRSNRPSNLRRPAAILTILAMSAMLAGTVSTTWLMVRPVPVDAACGTSLGCSGGTATSSITVVHSKSNGVTTDNIEPNDGENWHVVATWSSDISAPSGCTCQDLHTAAVDVDVQWSDSTGWSATCTGCNPYVGPIWQVSICGIGGCGSQQTVDNSWSYELIVDIADTLANQNCPLVMNTTNAFLSSVAYATTVVDNGNVINTGNCSESTAVSPTSQVFSVTDSGGFECPFTCADAAGPSVTITYQ